MKYRYYWILIVIVTAIIAIRLKNSLRVFYSEEMAIEKLVVVTEEPYQTISKQIMKFDDVTVETGEILSLEAGDVLRIKGVAKTDFSSGDGQVGRWFYRKFRLVQPQIFRIQNDEAPVWFRILSVTAKLRRVWQGIYEQVLPEPQAALVAGMTFGWDLKVQESFYQNLRTTGTLHVVAASGQNVAILAQAVLVGLLWLMGRRRAVVGLVVIIAGYGVISGMSPSIVRAAIMGVLSFIALALGRQQDGLVTLGIAMMVMLAWKPLLVFDVGWQLSVAATAGILVIYPKLPKKLGFLGEELGVTVAAQIATLPILMISFASLSLISPIVNVMIAPLVPVIMVGGGMLAVVGSVWLGLARVAAVLVWVPATVFIKIVEVMARVPGAQVPVRGLPWWWAIGYYLLLGAVIARRSERSAQ